MAKLSKKQWQDIIHFVIVMGCAFAVSFGVVIYALREEANKPPPDTGISTIEDTESDTIPVR